MRRWAYGDKEVGLDIRDEVNMFILFESLDRLVRLLGVFALFTLFRAHLDEAGAGGCVFISDAYWLPFTDAACLLVEDLDMQNHFKAN